MRTFFLLTPYVWFGWLLWRLILKEGAYPPYVPSLTKKTHAVVLFYIMGYSWVSACNLLLYLNHPGEAYLSLWLQPSALGPPPHGLISIIETLCSILVLMVCQQLAGRKNKFIKWLFVVWPMEIACSVCVGIYEMNRKHYPQRVITLGIIVICVAFVWTIAFYLLPSVRKMLFGEQLESTAPLAGEERCVPEPR